MINDWCILFAAISGGLGFIVGRLLPRPQITTEQIKKAMKRIANIEEFEERERLLRLRLARTGRKTYRFDSGPNARMSKMRIHKRRKMR